MVRHTLLSRHRRARALAESSRRPTQRVATRLHPTPREDAEVKNLSTQEELSMRTRSLRDSRRSAVDRNSRRHNAMEQLRENLRSRRVAEEDPENDIFEVEEEDLDDMDFGDEEEEGLDLSDLDVDDLADLTDEDLEEPDDEACPPCPPCAGAEGEEETEEEAAEGEEEEAAEGEEEEAAEGEEEETAEGEEEETAEGEEEDDKEDKKKDKKKDKKDAAAAPAKKDAEAEDTEPGFLVQRLFTEKELAEVKDASFDLTLFNENSDDPHYVVTANGYPIAEIRQSDQNFKGGFSDLFLRPAYKNSIREGIKVFGPVQALHEVKARFYATAAYEGEVAEVLKQDITAGLERQQKERLAELKDNYLNVASMVLEGSIKNFWGENELKAALQAQMRKVGISENTSIDLIEGAWREAAAPYFQSVLEKADELMGAHPDVMKHYAEQIARLEWRHPGYETEEAIPSRLTQHAASVPLTTGPSFPQEREAAVEAEDGVVLDKDYWKGVLRMGSKYMTASTNNYADFQKRLQKRK